MARVFGAGLGLGRRVAMAVAVSAVVLAGPVHGVAGTAAAAGAEPGSLTIITTSGPITGFPLGVEGGDPNGPVHLWFPTGGPEPTCRVSAGRVEHVGSSRTCLLSLIRLGEGTYPDAYSRPTVITFTGRYPTAFSGFMPDGYAQSSDHPLQIGAGWVINTQHAPVLDLPPITGSVDVTINGIPQPPLSLTPWSGPSSGVVSIEARGLSGLPTGAYTVTYSYGGDAFHEPANAVQRFEYVPNRFQETGKKPAKRPAARPHGNRHPRVDR